MPSEQTQSEQNERHVAEYLSERHGLTVVRLSEAQRAKGKTPDFKVMKDGQLAFYCEVKTITRDDWIDRKLRQEPPLAEVERIRTSDKSLWNGQCGPYALITGPVHDRLTSDILRAVQQFSAVNPDRCRPNVLFIVNHEGPTYF